MTSEDAIYGRNLKVLFAFFGGSVWLQPVSMASHYYSINGKNVNIRTLFPINEVECRMFLGTNHNWCELGIAKECAVFFMTVPFQDMNYLFKVEAIFFL